MPANFIACDRDQVMLMPPSLLDWVPSDHLVWTILSSVAEMDLDAFYGAYRSDGHGRPAYDPSMMVALLCTPIRVGTALRARSSGSVVRM
jgi:transposase